MDMKLNIVIIWFISFLCDFSLAQSGVLDISKFGGKPNADITQAFTSAWTEACASTTASKIVIPGGSYKMSALEVKGPCKAPIEVQVDGTITAPGNPSDLKGAEQWVRFNYVGFFTLSGKGVFDGVGEASWKANDCDTNKNCKMLPMNFGFNFLNNSIVRDVTSKDSKSFNVMVFSCHNITFDNFKVIAPGTSANTDGIHIGKSTDVKILNTNIATGDDCVSLGDGNKNVTVQNLNCGPGHGISVGSLGRYTNEEAVEGLFVKNCTLTGTTNGLRIKTWPSAPGTSPITDMHFEDVIMVNVSNPIIIDQEYCPWNQCSKQSPSKIKISKVSFKNIQGTSATQEGVVLVCSSGTPCDTVELNNVDLTFNGAPATAKCANVKPIMTGKTPTCGASGPAAAAA